MSGSVPDTDIIAVTHGSTGTNTGAQHPSQILVTPTGGSQTTLTNALGNTVGGPFLPAAGGQMSGPVIFSGSSQAPPSYAPRSAGTKIVLLDAVSPTTNDTALGIDANTFWLSMPAAAYSFVWWAGGGRVMQLTGTAILTVGGIANNAINLTPGYPPSTSPAVISTTGSAGLSITGVANASNAGAGQVGEFISSNVPGGSAISLTTNTGANVTSISLTAGDWDVEGNVAFGGSTTAMTLVEGWLNTVSAAQPVTAAGFAVTALPTGVVANANLSTGRLRVSIAATTTVYLGALAQFASGTCLAYGFIGARRVR